MLKSYSKRKRRGGHRRKRIDTLAHDPVPLSPGAPVGAYLSDRFVLKLFDRGGLDESLFLISLRDDISRVVASAMNEAKGQLNLRPRLALATERFLDDLRDIQYRIERNKRLHPLEIFISTRRPDPYVTENSLDEVCHLRDSLQQIGALIQRFCERNTLATKPGNYDWFTRAFIDRMFDLWITYVKEMTVPRESRQFSDFIAAAWRDAELPINDEDGGSLEDRLADRIRKNFPKGVSVARLAHQNREISTTEL